MRNSGVRPDDQSHFRASREKSVTRGISSFGLFRKSVVKRDEMPRRTSMLQHLRLGAIVIFGIIFPLVLLSQAFLAVGKSDFQASFETTGIEKSVPSQLSKLVKPDDYTLYALIYLETSNRKVMLNKQLMKMAIIHIGFAVISIGMLLLLLGIDAGGVDFEGEHAGVGAKINLKIASTGVVVFVIGATMAALGGLLINQYKTPDIPPFGGRASETSPISAKQILDKYDKCHQEYEKSPLLSRACIANWMDEKIH